jgi:hypothetical protein
VETEHFTRVAASADGDGFILQGAKMNTDSAALERMLHVGPRGKRWELRGGDKTSSSVGCFRRPARVTANAAARAAQALAFRVIADQIETGELGDISVTNVSFAA